MSRHTWCMFCSRLRRSHDRIQGRFNAKVRLKVLFIHLASLYGFRCILHSYLIFQGYLPGSYRVLNYWRSLNIIKLIFKIQKTIYEPCFCSDLFSTAQLSQTLLNSSLTSFYTTVCCLFVPWNDGGRERSGHKERGSLSTWWLANWEIDSTDGKRDDVICNSKGGWGDGQSATGQGNHGNRINKPSSSEIPDL